MSRQPEADYYELLQVRDDADPDVIEAAYTRLRERHSGDPERVAQLEAAYATLSDPDKRADYDSSTLGPPGAATAAVHEEAPPEAVGEGMEPMDVRDGELIQRLENLFPLAWASTLAALCALGVYKAVDKLP